MHDYVRRENFTNKPRLHLHFLCVGILFNSTALGIHFCETSLIFNFKTRLGGEICLCDVNMHKGYLGTRPRAREKGGEAHLPSFFLARHSCFPLVHILFPCPLAYYSLSRNCWDTFVSPCPLNVGVQGLVTEPR